MTFKKQWFVAPTAIVSNLKEREKIMKKIIGILLVGLVGFLGCSDGNDGTSTFNGQSIPVAPFGITDTMTPTYEWTPTPGATRYQLLVEDINEATVMEEWYTAEEGECASEDDLCSVTPDLEVWGNTWKVLACAGEECGLWSDELQFSYIVAGPTPKRFYDHDDGTVTDYNTKLMWSKNADPCSWKKWSEALSYCDGLTLAGHSDWRLPSMSEFKSLIDPRRVNPALPPGNPFMNVQSTLYWSSTTYGSTPGLAWSVSMGSGNVLVDYKDFSLYYVWPVRSGN